jgi:WD40 repeat protein
MPGDTVILRAAPDQFMNYRFSGWSGDTLKTSSDTAWVVMTSPTRAVTAIYTPQFTLAIQAVGNVYTKTPDKNFYLTGETVKIVATPPANDPITLWSGDTTRTSNDTAWVTFESTGKSIVLQCTTPVIGSFTVDHTNDILCFSYSPDGTRIATGSRDKSAKLLDVNGQTIRTFSGHTGIVEAIAFSPDGTMLLTGSSDSTARLWNVETGALVRTFYGHTGGVMDVAFSPNGAKIITGSLDSTARLWNTATGVIIDTLSGHTDIVQTVACSPDGATVATGSFDKTVKIWDIATGEVRHTLNACTWQVFSIAYSPDGSTILTGGNDSLTTAKLWNANTGALIHEFGGSECTYTVAFSRSGKKILTGGAAHHAILWDAQAYTVIRDINMSAVAIWRLTFSPDERYALLLYKDTKNVYRMYAR